MTIELHQHQKDGINFIVSSFIENNIKAFLLADETGIGKTYTSIGSSVSIYNILKLQNPNLEDILVVCPLSVVEYWEKSFNELYPDFKNVTVLNYHKLKQLFTKHDVNEKIVYHPKKTFSIIIFDESHQLKNYSSQFYKYSKILSESSNFILYVSATPAQSPLEVAYLQPLLGFDNYFKWIHTENFAIYKHPTRKHLTWSPNPLDIEKLYNLIYPTQKGLRRRSVDIAGWPEQQLITLPIKLTKDEFKEYNNTFNEYLAKREENGNKKLSEDTQQMLKASLLRYKISQLKVPHTILFVKDILQSNCKVAIFCDYLETMDLLKDGLKDFNPLILNGKTPKELRQDITTRFRYNSEHRVIISNIYQSINLEQPSDTHPVHFQVNHDISWSGIKAIQTNGRCHRNGKHCVIYNIFATNTIDQKVVTVMTERCRNASKIAGDTSILNQSEADFFESLL